MPDGEITAPVGAQQDDARNLDFLDPEAGSWADELSLVPGLSDLSRCLTNRYKYGVLALAVQALLWLPLLSPCCAIALHL